MNNLAKKFTYFVEVQKKYFNEKSDDTLTMRGVVPVSASDPSDAIAQVNKLRLEGLQTCDSRIRWDMRRPITGWTYEDFSFNVTGEVHLSGGKFSFNHSTGL